MKSFFTSSKYARKERSRTFDSAVDRFIDFENFLDIRIFLIYTIRYVLERANFNFFMYDRKERNRAFDNAVDRSIVLNNFLDIRIFPLYTI
jgi:hypothetical protein